MSVLPSSILYPVPFLCLSLEGWVAYLCDVIVYYELKPRLRERVVCFLSPSNLRIPALTEFSSFFLIVKMKPHCWIVSIRINNLFSVSWYIATFTLCAKLNWSQCILIHWTSSVIVVVLTHAFTGWLIVCWFFSTLIFIFYSF